MRLVQVLIPKGKRTSVVAALDEEEIDYVIFEETGRGDFEAMVQFPVPPSGVEPVLEHLREAGVSEDAYTIVLPTETVISRRLAALQERYSGLRISREELLARAEDLSPATSTYVAFLVLSTVIATTGLLLDSAATIIGAMVVAPLMGPAITASVGTIVDERDLVARGVTLQVGGLLLAIAVGALLGLLVKESFLVPPGLDIRTIPQVTERTSPNFLSLFLALGSGVAGALSIVRNAGSALVGVAIAVALIPPAATSGLGIAWGYPGVAIAAAVLVLVNLLAINLSALLLFWLSGYRPTTLAATDRARRAVRARAAVFVVALLVLSLVLGLVTYASFQTASFDNRARETASAVVNSPEYSQLDFVSATVEYDSADLVLRQDPHVDVVVGYPAGSQPPPDLAERIDARITDVTGRDVSVRVGFVLDQRTGALSSPRSAVGVHRNAAVLSPMHSLNAAYSVIT
ncbi:TIGR00341 family protein [Halorussus halophilus]|uniref:TIGR00341 family protein n=1 Tax=Halorussus halophilus TaxID=2650975 RepID=UPI00130122C3|nr:TIGR00341 family protein [Halorussus halophilus]